jgi:isoquinoline 1-oxidoreductase subunit beta
VRGLVEGKNKDFVAVVASNYYNAAFALRKAKEQGTIVWDDSKALSISTGDVYAAYQDALKKGASYSPRRVIDADGDMKKANNGRPPVTKTYQVPFLAHMTMEPLNATALVSDKSVKVWAGHQSGSLVQWFAGYAAGVNCNAVEVATRDLGGGFGRRADLGYVAKAVEIARHFKGVPVQTIWSREEDIRDDFFRPAAMAEVSAVPDKDGLPVTLTYRVAVPSVSGQMLGRVASIGRLAALRDRSTVDGAIFPFYGLPNRSIENLTVDLGIPVGFWRSVGYSFNTFFFETFIDELADAARADPIAYRERLLKAANGTEASKRALAVLEKLKEFAAKNAKPSPSNQEGNEGKVGRGFSLSECFRSFVGQFADVEVIDKTIKVHRVFAVVDCGFAIDPANVRRQVRSAINFGLSAALYGKVDIDNGQIVPKNFDDYQVLGLHDAPEIIVDFVDVVKPGYPLGGVGEIGTPGIAPAVGNAIFNAIRRRLRSLPLRVDHDVS